MPRAPLTPSAPGAVAYQNDLVHLLYARAQKSEQALCIKFPSAEANQDLRPLVLHCLCTELLRRTQMQPYFISDLYFCLSQGYSSVLSSSFPSLIAVAVTTSFTSDTSV